MTEPIVLEEIILYNPDGTPARRYERVELDSERVIDTTKEYQTKSFAYLKSQSAWSECFQRVNDGRELPSAAVLYACFERMVDEEHPALARFIKDINGSGMLCTNTKLNYGSNTVFHYEKENTYTSNFNLTEGMYKMEDAIENGDLAIALQVLFMPKDIIKLVNVLHVISQQCPNMWVASREHNERVLARVPRYLATTPNPQRAIEEGIVTIGDSIGMHFIDCGGFHDSCSRARGVRLK